MYLMNPEPPYNTTGKIQLDTLKHTSTRPTLDHVGMSPGPRG
jgi:hypothetical protein